MVLKTFLVIISLFVYVVSDSCVTYDFEEDFNNLFGSYGICENLPFWRIGEYSSLDLASPNNRSTKFIAPQIRISCASSFHFTMNAGGSLEVNLYMEATNENDHLQILVQQDRLDGIAYITGMKIVTSVNGWETEQIPLAGPNVYQGYISIIGMAAPNSTVLVDSFRYIPPGMDESACWIYDAPPTTPAPDSCIELPINIEDIEWFWTRLIIALTISLNILVLLLTCIVFYEIGRSGVEIPYIRRIISTLPATS